MKYACFISFRHGEHEEMRVRLEQFYKALAGKLELSIGNGLIWIDEKRIDGSNTLDTTLARALCESACMIVIYTGPYFHEKDTFCAREYEAMKRLEEERFRLLGTSSDLRHGFIIHVIFYGSDLLPPLMKGRYCYTKFEKFNLLEPDISRHPEFEPEVKEIADVVSDIYKELLNNAKKGIDFCRNCDTFALKTHEEIQQWLQEERILDSVRQPRKRRFSPMPGREEK
jgi:hypothetical protein